MYIPSNPASSVIEELIKTDLLLMFLRGISQKKHCFLCYCNLFLRKKKKAQRRITKIIIIIVKQHTPRLTLLISIEIQLPF